MPDLNADAVTLAPYFPGELPAAVAPLPPALRARLERFFGAGLSDVRVREGPEPAGVGAAAFAAGADLHFAPGWYRPWTPAGRALIVHEVAHVLQQRAGRVRVPADAGIVLVQDPRLEAEADRAARAWRHGTPAPVRCGRALPPAQAYARGGSPVQCAIFVGGSRISVDEARRRLGPEFDLVLPRRLVDQALTRFDFSNRRFPGDAELKAAVREVIAEESPLGAPYTLSHFKPFAQFKQVTKGAVGPVPLAVLRAPSSSKAKLSDEYASLETLRMAGLRVAPVFGGVEEENGMQTMIERWITGNLIDVKLGLNDRQGLAVVAALMGVPMPPGEAMSHKPAEEEVNAKFKAGVRPTKEALNTAISDFKNIKAFLAHHYISDLQGILELETGRFYIMDPLAVVPRDKVTGIEISLMKTTSQLVDAVIGQLQEMLKQVTQ